MRIIVAVGARPNVVKVGPLLPALRSAGLEVEVAYTGSREHQAADSATGVVSYYGIDLIEPRWFLDIGTGTHAVLTGRAMVAFEELFSTERPDAVMVVGDVSTTLAAAVSAAKAGVSVIHLEAGLRCGDLRVPEEVNRVLISRVAAMHLTPTEAALEMLEDEGVEPERIHFVGSMMAESVVRNMDMVRGSDAAAQYEVVPKEFVLAAFHRPENVDSSSRMGGIMAGLAASKLPVLLPDTNGLRVAIEHFALIVPDSVRMVGPVPYPTMLALESAAAAVITDSGGVQEEACVIGTPCVTVRECTEQVETLLAGANELVSAEGGAISRALSSASGVQRSWVVPKRWDRAVSDRVVRALKRGVLPLR